ncbi:hypothetical protein NKR23_g10201 [Pleurostoma richardsiae]|uniref:Copper acquisition factor BIM1-like domain-containing protein n=1 Tax=Pleurostoma richardsiae TaxID=41990 RepID=A0AA38RKY5_9PEZI|nr:hypothetical protein NKR23_g10201 [Pleurostoma richardsiae]
MYSRQLLLALAAFGWAAIAGAHFVLQIPTSLGFDDDHESTGPCDTFDPTDRSNVVTDWAINGGNIGLLTTHPNVTWEINAALATDTTNWVPVVEPFAQTGFGQVCFAEIPGFSAWAGQPVVLQLKQHAPDGVLYQCAAINFVAGGPDAVPSDCTNDVNVVIDPIIVAPGPANLPSAVATVTYTADAPSSTTPCTTSSSAAASISAPAPSPSTACTTTSTPAGVISVITTTVTLSSVPQPASVTPITLTIVGTATGPAASAPATGATGSGSGVTPSFPGLTQSTSATEVSAASTVTVTASPSPAVTVSASVSVISGPSSAVAGTASVIASGPSSATVGASSVTTATGPSSGAAGPSSSASGPRSNGAGGSHSVSLVTVFSTLTPAGAATGSATASVSQPVVTAGASTMIEHDCSMVATVMAVVSVVIGWGVVVHVL